MYWNTNPSEADKEYLFICEIHSWQSRLLAVPCYPILISLAW